MDDITGRPATDETATHDTVGRAAATPPGGSRWSLRRLVDDGPPLVPLIAVFTIMQAIAFGSGHPATGLTIMAFGLVALVAVDVRDLGRSDRRGSGDEAKWRHGKRGARPEPDWRSRAWRFRFDSSRF